MGGLRPGDKFLHAARRGLDQAGRDPERPLVVAFSGGADSTALLLACDALGREHGAEVLAAHFDHRIRADSAADKTHVEEVARLLGVSVAFGEGDVPEFARSHGISVETAARELRYRFMAAQVRSAGAQGVATGHTMDDQAETVLMNALRGSGGRGMAGMRPRMDRPAGTDWPAVTVLRPLLHVRRTDCESVCRAAGVTWLEDPSNRDTTFTRNRMRHEVLPQLDRSRPGSIEALSRLADHARELDEFVAEVAASGAPITHSKGGASVNRAALRSMRPAVQSRALSGLYEAVNGSVEGLETDHIVAMRDLVPSGSGTSVSLPNGLVFRADYHTVSITRAGDGGNHEWPKSVPTLELSVPGAVGLPGGFTIKAEIVDSPADPASRPPNVVFLSVDAIGQTLTVRSRRQGDRFHAMGMTSPMKLQDFFVNAHVPERVRDRVPLVEAGRGIAWVTGHRIAEWAKLEEGAQRAVRLELKGPPVDQPGLTGS